MPKNKKHIHKKTTYKLWWIVASGVFILILISNLIPKMKIVSKSIFEKNVFPPDALIPTVISSFNNELTKEDYIKSAKEDLAQKLHTGVNQIQIGEISEKEFADTSLGCPQRDKLYAQVITPGYQIALIADENTYIYNAALNIIVTC